MATDGLTHTIAKLQEIGSDHYRVLLTMVPPKPRTEGAQLRQMLVEQGIPVFKSEIPRLAAFEKAAAEGVPVYGSRTTKTPSAHGKRMRQLRRSCSIMAQRKFAALANLRQREPDPPPVEDMPSPPEAPPVAAAPEPAPPPAQVPVPVLQEPQKGRGRHAYGKRSDRTGRRALVLCARRSTGACRLCCSSATMGSTCRTGGRAAYQVDSETAGNFVRADFHPYEWMRQVQLTGEGAILPVTAADEGRADG